MIPRQAAPTGARSAADGCGDARAGAPEPSRRVRTPFLLAAVLLAAAFAASGKDALPASDDPAVEARMLRITSELRCLVCQNQTIADSHAELAQDLREEVRGLIRKGSTDQQVVEFMTARYGDFVLYRPALQPKTWLLWFGPAALLVGGGAGLVTLLRRRQRMPDDRFEAEAPGAEDGEATFTPEAGGPA